MALKRNETPEEREKRLMRQKLYYENRKLKETPEQRAERLNREKERVKKKLQNESFIERTKRLTKLQKNQYHRLANETPEMRKHRLEQLRLNQARRLANETPEMRKIRLEKLRINQARRLAKETPEVKQQRLEKLKLNRLKRLGKQTEDGYTQTKLKDCFSNVMIKTTGHCKKRLNNRKLPADSGNGYKVYSAGGDGEENTNNVGVFQFVSCEIEPSQEFEEEEMLNEYYSSDGSVQHRDEEENGYLSSEGEACCSFRHEAYESQCFLDREGCKENENEECYMA